MAQRKLRPVHPGEVLLEEFLRPLGLSQYRLAKETSVPATAVSDAAFVRGRRSRPVNHAAQQAIVDGQPANG